MKWQRFLDSLDTMGGHLFVLASAALFGCALAYSGNPDGHTVLVGAGGALLALLRSNTSAR